MLLLWQRLNGQSATRELLRCTVDQYFVTQGVTPSVTTGASSLLKASSDEISEQRNQLNGASGDSRLEQCYSNESAQRVESSDPRTSNVSGDIAPVKAFGSEKTPERQRKISESGNNGSNDSLSEPCSSSESLQKKKEQGGLQRKLKNFFSLKKKATKAFGTEDGVQGNMCDKVYHDKVKLSTKEDINHILAIRDRYETEKHPGCVLVLNNSFLGSKKLRRHGAEIDVKNMEELWSQMGCDIYGEVAQQEKTADEMKQLLKDMRNLKKKYSYIVVVIMTHGTKVGGNVVFHGVDGRNIYVNEIDMIFNNQNAPQLRNMPKFFIFQFYCGDEPDRGVSADCKKLEAEIEQLSLDKVHTDGDGDKMPTNSDMLFAYATHVNHSALRSPYNGSWFITAITNVFMDLARCEDVQRMLNRVRESMKGKSGQYEEVVDGKTVSSEVCAMGWSRSSFTKQLFLLPGHKRP